MSDGLTGIANRRCFDQRLAVEWQRHVREQRSLALLLVDVDCFKLLNDARGHLCGDECLRELARLCTEVAADNGGQELVARYGGEELALLLPESDLHDAPALPSAFVAASKRWRWRIRVRAWRHTSPSVSA